MFLASEAFSLTEVVVGEVIIFGNGSISWYSNQIMGPQIEVQPLPYKKRHRTFLFLIFIFLVSLPFLYMYATGYRFDMTRPTSIVSTGGMYIAVERAGSEIYIDGELVRETRTFKKAFYAQNIDVGTHRVHVQKEGYHTWVKEFPVSKKLVTEAEAFNLPLVPHVRILSEWYTATGSPVVWTPLLHASTTQSLVATTTKATTTLTKNDEYAALIHYFATTTEKVKKGTAEQIREILTNATTTDEVESATTTIVSSGVRLAKMEDELYATWIGPFEEMPYYYCAPDFPPYSTTSTMTENDTFSTDEEETVPEEGQLVMHPVQTVPENIVCDPSIRIDRKWQEIRDFDFFPRSTDFVVVALDDGIYVVEVDDRSWQNVQPLIMGDTLSFHIDNGNIYVYDGILIYHILLEAESES